MTASAAKFQPAHTYYTQALGCAAGLVAASEIEKRSKTIIVAENRKQAEELLDDILLFSPAGTLVLFLPEIDTLPFEPVLPTTTAVAQRYATLVTMLQQPRWCTITYPAALLHKVPTTETILHCCVTITSNSPSITSLPDLHRLALVAGYIETSNVQDVGDVALRGNVLDIFSPTAKAPIRIDITEGTYRLRVFDPETQRTTAPQDTFVLVPVREGFGLRSELQNRQPYLAAVASRAKAIGVPPSELQQVLASLSNLKLGDQEPLEVALVSSLFGPHEDLSDILTSTKAELLLVNPEGILAKLTELGETIATREQTAIGEQRLFPAAADLFSAPAPLHEYLERYCTVTINGFVPEGSTAIAVGAQLHTELLTQLKSKSGSAGGLSPLIAYISRQRRAGYKVAFVVGSEVRAERLSRILLEHSVDSERITTSLRSWSSDSRGFGVGITIGYISQGAILPGARLVVIAEQEIFNERSYRKGNKAKITLKKLMNQLGSLTPDDLLVHTDYGIGKYLGLSHMTIEESEQDFLHIQYSDSVLYLPVQHIGKVHKYAAAEGATPTLDSLGSNRWVKTKEKVKEAVLPLAGDLIRLYAARSAIKGWRFEPKGAEDERFADDFPYQETPDQLKAIDDTLTDMASEWPMDRLVCGDVGFGKTEVAIRAAFKATQHAKQVAVVCPTTLLCEQHYRTFLQRFKDTPIKIGIISRFYHGNQNRQTLERLASGDLDIVVGTHRLLQRDVTFHDLGLVVVDEEHRFGVKQKERLKALKTQVDVLTLTATPIPRTLHMALLNIRDISVIATPPVDRQVIRTYVANYDEGLVHDAISRELDRRGQVFFLHNRVETISGVAARLRELLPHARIQFAHGQMDEEILEEIMLQFLRGEIDVLVSTTIIESGIDIPNANTVIIDRADMFGLAQLYQIRGRVGRSNRQAYCYFLVPNRAKITSTAQQRLKALQSLDELGLGFNLAMRDLEIRGAGNLLGKEQSGQVLNVGFELYMKIVKDAVLHLQGETASIDDYIEPEVKLGFSAYIPDDYIPDVSERLVMYQRLASAQSHQELEELRDEMLDRFGSFGPEVRALLEVMQYRVVARMYRIEKIELKGSHLALSFAHKAPVDATKALMAVKRDPRKLKFTKSNTLSLWVDERENTTSVYRRMVTLLKEVELQR